ncbi:MAG: tRNA (adenosine(37)-N6)-threonylcarbamoyltransferase complex transferase subunit TsaD [Defluviitaleaceae bacterium]|nr:tRNA (adenosine(37)-N6)-threonylcarbamoyltransferase complex transferase subunit TsaD [Defluviitaleaceae bacterium]
MTILGIETSCDETSVAVVRNGREVLSNVIASQVELHAPFGGVVPEIAARRHIECIGSITDEALRQAEVSFADIDAYAVANGPGLAGALLVGLNYAKALAYVNKKPLVGVQHIEGHVCANFLEGGLEPVCAGESKSKVSASPPFLSLVVSGGHTLLLAVTDYDTYKVIGSTRDDAAGEAFDKVARVLGLPYPGGPEIDRVAANGSPDAVAFPRAKVRGYDFSFSGLKTAVVQHVAKLKQADGTCSLQGLIPDIAASFQQAVVDVLVERATTACKNENFSHVALAGGVACNKGLRAAMETACREKGIGLSIPKPVYCTDNAAMIASRGYYRLAAGHEDDLALNAFPGRMV